MTGDLLVIALIAGRRCALSALDVKSVIEVSAVTPIPRAPVWIAGITALRSQALTVIDCRRAIGVAGAGEWPTDHRAIVVADGGHSYALLVDGIEDITTAAGEEVTFAIYANDAAGDPEVRNRIDRWVELLAAQAGRL